MDLLDEGIVPEHALDVKREAREFAAEYIEPHAADFYESGDYPWEVLEAGMDAGLVAQDISEEYGGRGLDLEQILAIAEEFYRADAGIALTLQLASFGCEITQHYGSEEQKEEYLRPVAENEQISGLAVSEPDTGSDMAGMTTAAERTDDGWRLNGEKFDDFGEDFYTTIDETDYALRFIDQALGKDKPFFTYLAYNAPHTPYQAIEEEVELFRKGGIDNEAVCTLYAMLRRVDEGVERLLELALKRQEFVEERDEVFLGKAIEVRQDGGGHLREEVLEAVAAHRRSARRRTHRI